MEILIGVVIVVIAYIAWIYFKARKKDEFSQEIGHESATKAADQFATEVEVEDDLTIAARNKESKEHFALAMKYLSEKNYSEAVVWLKKAADQNNFEAQYLLGSAYISGEGIDKDLDKAFHWIEKSAKQGNSRAYHVLAGFYHSGQGVEQNLPEAIYWFEKAAEQNDTGAEFMLAKLYLKEGAGVESNQSIGARWCEVAAEQGYAKAQYMTGCLYSKGIGVTKDDEKSRYWLNKAAELGISDADVDAIDSLLNSDL